MALSKKILDVNRDNGVIFELISTAMLMIFVLVNNFFNYKRNPSSTFLTWRRCEPYPWVLNFIMIF